MNESSLPPLRDLPAGRLDQRAEHLRAEITEKSATPRLTRVRPVLVAVVVALVALALVPIGGASLGQRAVDGVSNLWKQPPPNQEALDVAANDAEALAGRAYFAGAAVNDAANTVDVYLAHAPQSVIDALNAQHPGIYVIHNNAPNTNAALLNLEAAFDEAPLKAEGIHVTEWGPTVDGYLQVGVTADVARAQSILEKIYGPNVVRVYKSQPFTN